MPEHTGSVVAKSEHGILFSDKGPWFNFSDLNHRGEPFDAVQKGDKVRIVYSSYSKRDGSTGYGIEVIENLSAPASSPPVPPEPFPPNDPFPPEQDFPPDATESPPAASIDRDGLIVRQTCIKAAAMALQHSATEDKAGAITYLAGVLEDWVNR